MEQDVKYNSQEYGFKEKVIELLAEGHYRLYLSLLLRHGKARKEDIEFVNKLWCTTRPS